MSKEWGTRINETTTDTELVMLTLLDIPFQSPEYYRQCEMICRAINRFPDHLENLTVVDRRLRCAEKVIENHVRDIVCCYRPHQTFRYAMSRTHRDQYVLSSFERWILDLWRGTSKVEDRIPISLLTKLFFRERKAPLQLYVDRKTHSKPCWFNS